MFTGDMSGILVFFFVTGLTPSLAHTLSGVREFQLSPNSTWGPVRLGFGWTDRSLVACVASCVDRFPTTCWTVLYHSGTHFCTPGDQLSPTEPLPVISEGDLYLGYSCDESLGFKTYTHNDVSVCLRYDLNKIMYEEAYTQCKSLNADLYTLKTIEKYQILQTFVTHSAWIGLDDVAVEGRLVWKDDGTDVDGGLMVELFGASSPVDNDATMDCAIYRPTAIFNMDQCTNIRGVVCERSL